MTIETSASSQTFPGNGVAVVFPCAFRIFDETDVIVSLVNPSTGTSTPLTLNSDYTIDGAGNDNGFTLSTTNPVATGVNLYVLRNIAYNQPTDFTNQGSFFPTMHEDMADRLEMQIQQLLDASGRAVTIPGGLFPAPSSLLPLPSPGSLLGWASDGSAIVNTGASGVGAGSISDVNVANGAGIQGTKLSFIQLGSHAQVRTQQDKSRDFFNVKDFGVKFDGVTDDTTAFQNALNDINAAGGGTIRLPAGSVKLGPITIPAGVSIKGEGKYTTKIIPRASSITLFTAVSLSQTVISDLCISCGSTASVNGFKFTMCNNIVMHRICFSGCLSNFEIDQGQNFDIDGCDSIGTSTLKAGLCKIWSSSDSTYVFNVALRRYYIYNLGNGVQGPVVYIRRGILCDLYQVKVNDASAGGAVSFIVLENDCQGVKLVQCAASASGTGLTLQKGGGITGVSPTFIDVISCDFDQSTVYGINITDGQWVKIIGGNVTSSGVNTAGTAVLVQSSASLTGAVEISGVTINGYNGTNGVGIYLSGTNGLNNVQIRDCIIDTCYYGMVVANTPTYVTAFGNVLRNCTNKLNGAVSGTGNWFANNQGLNPFTVAAPSMPASGVAATNTTGVPVRVVVTGGTVSQIAINGTGMLIGTINTILNPGETIAITYSSAPGWAWVGM